MAGETFLTRQGYEKLRQDLADLRERRIHLTKEIQEAAEKGDLKENAEYHAAKEAHQKITTRMDEIETKLRSARIIEEADIKEGEIRIGTTVQLKDEKSGEEVTYTLVDGAEADFAAGKISVRSPLAQGILGHKEGESIQVKLPSNVIHYKVVKVTRSI